MFGSWDGGGLGFVEDRHGEGGAASGMDSLVLTSKGKLSHPTWAGEPPFDAARAHGRLLEGFQIPLVPTRPLAAFISHSALASLVREGRPGCQPRQRGAQGAHESMFDEMALGGIGRCREGVWKVGQTFENWPELRRH